MLINMHLAKYHVYKNRSTSRSLLSFRYLVSIGVKYNYCNFKSLLPVVSVTIALSIRWHVSSRRHLRIALWRIALRITPVTHRVIVSHTAIALTVTSIQVQYIQLARHHSTQCRDLDVSTRVEQQQASHSISNNIGL